MIPQGMPPSPMMGAPVRAQPMSFGGPPQPMQGPPPGGMAQPPPGGLSALPNGSHGLFSPPGTAPPPQMNQQQMLAQVLRRRMRP